MMVALALLQLLLLSTAAVLLPAATAEDELLSRSPPIVLPLRNGSRHFNQSVDPKKVGIVVIDFWDSGNCKTEVNRLKAMFASVNTALAGLRSLGMTVIWAPSDVQNAYVGTPQRERAFWTPRVPVVEKHTLKCTNGTDKVDYDKCGFGASHFSGCECGHGTAHDLEHSPGVCDWDIYSWGAMAPELEIGDEDYIVDGAMETHWKTDSSELLSITADRGLTTLLYFGTATQICLTFKPVGMLRMQSLGLQVHQVRDMSEAYGDYIPGSYTVDNAQQETTAHIEHFLAPSVSAVELLRIAGQWPEHKPVDRVLFAPWGSSEWPHFFAAARGVQVTMTQLSLRWAGGEG